MNLESIEVESVDELRAPGLPYIAGPLPSATRVAALYVATDLQFWPTDQPDAFCIDVQIDDVAYRRLDPEYFAWLRSRMTLARTAANAGHLDRPAFDQLCEDFNRIQEWALAHIGQQALLRAMRSLDPQRYVPPCVKEAARRTQSTVRAIDAHALARAADLVDVIRDSALALGWTHASLYQTQGRLRFPFGPHYGLICFLKSTDRIGKVTREYIEIIAPPPTEVCRRFYNPAVEQPWRIPVSRQPK